MTPKEKAKELVDNYTEIIYPIVYKKKSKQCALIVVDEMLNNLSLISTIEEMTALEYWQEVKQEIETL